jgi:hypothetical protein
VVQAVQVERILEDLSAELTEANREVSAEPLLRRVGGGALAMLQAQYAAKAANPDEAIYELGTSFGDSQIVARSRDWPRSFAVSTEPDPKAQDAQFIYLLEQTDARAPYQMVLWARMLKTPPKTSPAVVGSLVVSPEDPDLAMTPVEAVEAYALAKDDPSGAAAELFDTKPSDGIDPDPARQRWSALVAGFDSPELKGLEGTDLSHSTELIGGSVSAVATADSGALVFGQVKSTLDFSFAGSEGQLMNLGAKGYLGLGAASLQPTKSVHIEHLESVVLAVPPKAGDGIVKVIAVADLPTAVTVE